MGLKRPSDFVLTLEDNDSVSGSESDSEPDIGVTNLNQKNKKRKIDDDLNSDFEFDGYGVLGGVIGIADDGWGFTGIPGMKESVGVDLDSIIARRREKSREENAKDVSNDEEQEEEEQDEEEDEEEEDEVVEGGEEFTGIEEDLGTKSIDNCLCRSRRRIRNGCRR